MLSGLCGLPSSAALFGISAWRRVPRVLRAERVVDSCRALPNSSLTYSLLESCPLCIGAPLAATSSLFS